MPSSKSPLIRKVRDSYGSTGASSNVLGTASLPVISGTTGSRRRYGNPYRAQSSGLPSRESTEIPDNSNVPQGVVNYQLEKPPHPKLSTLAGVTMPTILNVLSILMFLRFGFILGQMGIVGTLFLLVLSYGINILTTLSVSAIATNGIVKGGGAYYMISRSLGVEFGGAIGIILFIGQILNSAMNAAGIVEPLLYNFGVREGIIIQILPDQGIWQLFYATAVLALCTLVALVGAGLVSRCGGLFCVVLLTATLSIPVSSIVMKPFDLPDLGVSYSGLSWETFFENLWPHYTAGAAGSRLATVETFNDLFGIFFPATAGILAGSSMSQDLANPSKAIPTGTLQGILVTVVCYFLVICTMGCAIPRQLLYREVQVLQTVSVSPILVVMGETAGTLFSIIVGLVGAAQLLQAISRDQIFPGLSKVFGSNKYPSKGWYAIAFSWLLCQLCLFADVNQLATMITMAFLMTFIAINVACGLLKIGSAPNFRPSFRYFNVYTAFSGTVASVVAMFIVDGLSACLVITFMAFLIVLIHYVSPPKQWGDVSQSLIYHQVRKYLLKLRQDNVKYWRPQILLLADNPRTTWRLIRFCNHLKKGGLYVLGHVLVTRQFQQRAGELNKQRAAWEKVRDLANIKAFVQIAIAPTFSWGVRNVFLGSGLGGMKPNITILAFYDLSNYSKEQLKLPSRLKFENRTDQYANQVDIGMDKLPTDSCALEQKVKLMEWVQTLEDLSLLNSNVAVAKGFPRLLIPSEEAPKVSESSKKYIDLYPIQMASKVTDKTGDKNMMTTNFDTYTLILQLGAILHTVPAWHKTHRLRVVVFVEYIEDVKEERERVMSLLDILRIEAEVVVKCLDSGEFSSYRYIARGEHITDNSLMKLIDETLHSDVWWKTLKQFRDEEQQIREMQDNTPHNTIEFPSSTENSVTVNSRAIRNIERSQHRGRYSFSKMNNLGVSLSMVANKLPAADIHRMTEESTEDDWSYSRSTSDTESVTSYASSISALPSPYILPKTASEHVPHFTIGAGSTASINGSNTVMSGASGSIGVGSGGNAGSTGNGGSNGTAESTTGGSTMNGSIVTPVRKNGNSAYRMRRPIFDTLKSSHSLRKERSSMMFTAETMPSSHVLEDAQGNEPSIVFIKDQKPKKKKEVQENTIKKDIAHVNTARPCPEGISDGSFVIGASGVTSGVNGFDGVKGGREANNFTASIDGIGISPVCSPKVHLSSSCDAGAVQNVNITVKNGKSSTPQSYSDTSSTSLSFNELPNKCQFLILNELMRDTSKNSALIFSTLPAPDIGLHESEDDCIEYAADLEVWCAGLPPTLLINAKTMTVTTNL
ncbi:hypothetical protein FOA43_001005 [Brettanomyces nanus]|uniref:Uncharacterized protein n=1 Tax=Eeniella nana TaxID=13502 RepID=A0A875S0Q3_EENNA|nr:uncharacterized protein FOA43_001005 [Brettanomyces nanus]QPG73692.1 hypothetical protein FOA43_001005 [Brettanomyces nanus]